MSKSQSQKIVLLIEMSQEIDNKTQRISVLQLKNFI